VVIVYRLNELKIALPAGASVIKSPEAAAIADAALVLAEAERKAKEIIADAQKRRVEEKKRGYREGLAKAAAESAARLLDEEAVLSASLGAIDEQLAGIVVACMRKIVGDFDGKQLAQAYITNAVRQMRRQKRIRLSVSSEHYRNIKDHIGSLAAEFAEIELIDVVENSRLSGTQFIMESEIGRIDGSIEKNLDELQLQLPAVLAGFVERLRLEPLDDVDADLSPAETAAMPPKANPAARLDAAELTTEQPGAELSP
jgi:type III secretion protein L